MLGLAEDSTSSKQVSTSRHSCSLPRSPRCPPLAKSRHKGGSTCHCCHPWPSPIPQVAVPHSWSWRKCSGGGGERDPSVATPSTTTPCTPHPSWSGLGGVLGVLSLPEEQQWQWIDPLFLTCFLSGPPRCPTQVWSFHCTLKSTGDLGIRATGNWQLAHDLHRGSRVWTHHYTPCGSTPKHLYVRSLFTCGSSQAFCPGLQC